MKRFWLGQRVVVARSRDVVVNSVGTVYRLRRADDGAWIALDARCADERVHPFQADDPRGTHVLAYPEDCSS
jgi:hypothetical protein